MLAKASMLNIELEKKRLEEIAFSYRTGSGFDFKLEKFRILKIKELICGDEILEVGCAEGIMTNELSKHFKHITAIDGSEELTREAKKLNLQNTEFVHTLFEEYKPDKKFDTVVLCNIIEHVKEPVELLKKAKEWIGDSGTVIVLCPNANSIHRQIGVLSGMINSIYDLNETDIKVGHRRVYDIEGLKRDITSSGLFIEKWGGVFLKPLSNSQMDQLDEKAIDAFYLIGDKLPQEFLTEIYVKCKK